MKRLTPPVLFGAALLVSGIVVRLLLLPVESADMREFLRGWYAYLQMFGGIGAIKDGFSNYSPPYLYLLAIAGKLAPGVDAMLAIKLISIAFDALAAWLIYKLAVLRLDRARASIVAGIFWCLPTVMLNSAAWGQCDVIHTALVLASLYWLFTQRPTLACAAFGAACAVKFQAAFIGPLFLALLVYRRMSPLHALAGVLSGAALLLPAWLAGADAGRLVTIYLQQGAYYRNLWKGAPNFYWLIPDTYYDWALFIGLLITAVAALALTGMFLVRRNAFGPRTMLALATLSAIALPFLLPKMLDRYFYMADVLALVFAVYFSRAWWLPLLMQLGSGLAYLAAFGWLPLPAAPGSALAAVCVLAGLLLLLWRVYEASLAHPAEQRQGAGAFALIGSGAMAALLLHGITGAPLRMRLGMDVGARHEARPQQPRETTFARDLVLLGADVQTANALQGGFVTFSAYHAAALSARPNLVLRVELRDSATGAVLAAIAREPRHSTQGTEATSLWQPGRAYRQNYAMPLTVTLAGPTRLEFHVTWQDAAGQPLPMQCASLSQCNVFEGPMAFPRQ